jgi:hypothetical protein
MTKTIVRSQEEFEKALTNKADEIEINGDFEGTLTYSPWLYVMENSQPHVVAWANSQPHVEASGNTMLRLTGKLSATARDTCVIYLHNGATCKGGNQFIAKPIKTAADWLDFYGVKVTRGIAILYKGVDEDFSTRNARRVDIFYKPGLAPSAPDWDPEPECGGGLHFSPAPSSTLQFNSDARHFIACPIKVSEIVVHENADYPDKVKAPRLCKPCYEVDRYGNPVKTSKAATE